MSQYKEQRGFLTFAINSDTVDYLELAYAQALNIKATQQLNKYAVVVDAATKEKLDERHHRIFDYIIDTPSDYSNLAGARVFGFECLAFWLTPFKETIKLESDLLFTRSIDHWWTTFRLKNIFLSTGCRNYLQDPSTTRRYRQVNDDNHLPDVYNGLMYFRFSRESQQFFTVARQIQENWQDVRAELKGCNDEYPTTDVLYALAAQVVGPEQCTAPSLDFVNFTHMKPAVNNFDEDQKFTDVFVTEFDQGMIRVNGVNQLHPFHYYNKEFVSDEMKEWYGSRIS